MRKIVLLMLLVSFLYGCGGQNSEQPETETTATPKITEREVITIDEQTTDSDKGTTDEPCFLSKCNCQCYLWGHVPLSEKKITCGSDCEKEYGIKGCRLEGKICMPIK